MEVLGDVVEVLSGGVKEFGDEGIGGVVAWEGGFEVSRESGLVGKRGLCSLETVLEEAVDG